ncbi:uncharacterized protein LOC108743668 [Agrilus planipennis]|uniref:Uncharacterized protein LOC108743668 n=1 Tax=Agrilus planipennis TaxID=224129 RepID=A0A7F5QZF1_AGRPL|nr:uncharacterized protein LOC108743668 [Agrilus planipennis]
MAINTTNVKLICYDSHTDFSIDFFKLLLILGAIMSLAIASDTCLYQKLWDPFFDPEYQIANDDDNSSDEENDPNVQKILSASILSGHTCEDENKKRDSTNIISSRLINNGQIYATDLASQSKYNVDTNIDGNDMK